MVADTNDFAIHVSRINEEGISALRQPAQYSPSVAGPPSAEDRSAVTDASGPAASTNALVPSGGDGTTRVEGNDEGVALGPTPAEHEEPPSGRPMVLLGHAEGTYGRSETVYYDPGRPGDQLPNPHISITGETGSGKTQATKSLIHELANYAMPALILDFKDDYSTLPFANDEGFTVYDASYDGLPFNPLLPPIDPVSGRANVAHFVHQTAEMLKRIYRLGDQQAYRLREAMKQVYADSGIPWNSAVLDAYAVLPTFDQVGAVLALDHSNDALLGRLSPMFDLGLFRTTSDSVGLGDFLNRPSVVRLSQLPGDEVKNAVAEFFLMALYNYLVRQPHSHALSRLLVLDEAWRLVESPFLIPLMREGRAFGVGVIIATQFPRDLPDEVRGSTATRLYFSQSQAEQIREIQRTIYGRTTGAEAEGLGALIRSLAPLSCIVNSKQYVVPARVSFTPYFERIIGQPG